MWSISCIPPPAYRTLCIACHSQGLCTPPNDRRRMINRLLMRAELVFVDNTPQPDPRSSHEEWLLPGWFGVMHRVRQTACSPLPMSLLCRVLTYPVHCHEFSVFILLLQGMIGGRVKCPDLPWMGVPEGWDSWPFSWPHERQQLWEAYLSVIRAMTSTFVLSLWLMARPFQRQIISHAMTVIFTVTVTLRETEVGDMGPCHGCHAVCELWLLRWGTHPAAAVGTWGPLQQ